MQNTDNQTKDTISLNNMSNEELDRLNQLKAMHMLIGMSKNDDLYYQWTDVFTDIPDIFDFEAVARNEEHFLECYETFCKLFADNSYLVPKEKVRQTYE